MKEIQKCQIFQKKIEIKSRLNEVRMYFCKLTSKETKKVKVIFKEIVSSLCQLVAECQLSYVFV